MAEENKLGQPPFPNSSSPPMTRTPSPPPDTDVLDQDLLLWLSTLQAEPVPPTPAARSRLLGRVRRSAQASRAMHTVRHADAAVTLPAPGVSQCLLYSASAQTRRLGEPERASLVTLAPGTQWARPGLDTGLQREWLLLRGQARIGGDDLGAEDFLLQPAGSACPALGSAQGALLMLREARLAAQPQDTTQVQRARDAQWVDFAPGIRRRVMWQRAGQAAMLYRTAPGAQVPHHGHGHDEECLMLEGDLFLDDVLLRPLDYQLAPAGTGHRHVSTDTDVVLYAHVDVALALRPD
jgi:quercetin dioxygenase-like cupin family protein